MSDRRLSQRGRPSRSPAGGTPRERTDNRKSLDIGVLNEHLGYFIRRLQVWVFQDFIRTLAPIDIRPAQYSVLVVIAANPGLSQSDLADRLGIERARLVRVLDKLEKRGLTQRLASPHRPALPCAAAHARGPENTQACHDAGGAARGEADREARPRTAEIDADAAEALRSMTSAPIVAASAVPSRTLAIRTFRAQQRGRQQDVDASPCEQTRRLLRFDVRLTLEPALAAADCSPGGRAREAAAQPIGKRCRPGGELRQRHTESRRTRKSPWKTNHRSWSERCAGYRVITLNRPQRLNAFNEAMHQALKRALADAEDDSDCRALLLTGAGRGFCAGQDLNDRLSKPGETAVLGGALETYYNPLVRKLRALPFPVVAAVNGVAAGAGANIALACDIVLAARSASFVQAFAKIGLVPDSGGTWFLPRLVGPARARGLALTGEPLSAEQAEAWGLIWKMNDDLVLMAEAHRLCIHFAAAPTVALALTKRVLDEVLGQ